MGGVRQVIRCYELEELSRSSSKMPLPGSNWLASVARPSILLIILRLGPSHRCGSHPHRPRWTRLRWYSYDRNIFSAEICFSRNIFGRTIIARKIFDQNFFGRNFFGRFFSAKTFSTKIWKIFGRKKFRPKTNSVQNIFRNAVRSSNGIWLWPPPRYPPRIGQMISSGLLCRPTPPSSGQPSGLN